jgi:hypothetical protein
LLAKRATFGQAALRLAGQLVDREIEADVRAATTRILLRNTEQAKEKAIEEAGFLYHLLFESRKTVSTVTQQTAQTSAVTAGNTARTTSSAAAQAASQAQAAAVGPSTVMGEAARAFAGTYASIAAIPYVGPFMAPGMATQAYATVAAFAPLAALASGTNYVPQTGLYTLHEGEAVVPKAYNSQEDNRVSNTRGGDTYGDTNIHNHFGPVSASADMVMAAVAKAVRNGHPAARNIQRGR